MIKNIKTINGIVYILYQTDQWETKSSYVCFGVFDSYEHASLQADLNGLKNSGDSKVVIKMATINQCAEVI